MRRLLPLLAAAMLAGCTAPTQPYTTENWVAWESALKSKGLLRTEREPRDAPFSNRDLIENFVKVAFGVDPEFESDAAAAQRRAGRVPLRRWEGPIRFAVIGNPGRDGNVLYPYLVRLAAVTGVEIAPSEDDEAAEAPNLLILMLDPAQRQQFAGMMREARPGLADYLEDWFAQHDLVCSADIYFGRGEERAFVIQTAMVLIRKELPDDLRAACIEEELAQVMGLARDDDSVRPSLFNEDAEFARLTTHDEFLLRMLYDPRLSPGMTARDAIPVLPGIVDDLRPGG